MHTRHDISQLPSGKKRQIFHWLRKQWNMRFIFLDSSSSNEQTHSYIIAEFRILFYLQLNQPFSEIIDDIFSLKYSTDAKLKRNGNETNVATFLQCSNKSILSRKHVVPGVLIFKSVTQRPSSDKCCAWYCWPASQSTAICGSQRGDAA